MTRFISSITLISEKSSKKAGSCQCFGSFPTIILTALLYKRKGLQFLHVDLFQRIGGMDIAV